MIARLLADTGDFELTVADSRPEALERISKLTGAATALCDATDASQLATTMGDCQSVISALSYHHNPAVAAAALDAGVSYFDLTEDVETTAQVRAIADKAGDGQIFMPQCGLAPGFISIIASHLAKEFDELNTVHMRVGALPLYPTGTLKYNLTWSTDGLINEYCNPCDAIHHGERIDVLPLEGLEEFSLDGVRYEAFNTSGGVGTLCDSLSGRKELRELNYKTVRYLGHRDTVALLANELRLRERRELFKNILETAVPITFQDVVVTFCTVTGRRKGQLVQISDARKVYHRKIGGEEWSAIQLTTAAGVCAVLDMHVAGQLPTKGFVRQEQVDLSAFLAGRFGKYYDAQITRPFSHDGGE